MDNNKFEQQYQNIYDIFNKYERYDIMLTAKHIKIFNEKGKNRNLDGNPHNQSENAIKNLIWYMLKASGEDYPDDALIWMLGNYYFECLRCPVWQKI